MLQLRASGGSLNILPIRNVVNIRHANTACLLDFTIRPDHLSYIRAYAAPVHQW